MKAKFVDRARRGMPALLWVFAAGASAQTTTSALEEIVVTATRREESISRVPISIQAYSQVQLDRMGVKEIDDISRITPGVTFYRAGSLGGATIISMRGVQAQAGTSAIGVYIDDTPINARSLNSTTTFYPQLFDLERVEVLQGPQGTLFGAGSESGTIRFISRQPDLETFSAYGRAEASSIAHGGTGYEAGLAMGGPLAPGKLGFRVSASSREQGGWTDRVSSDGQTIIERDANTVRYDVLRGALTWAPTETFTLTPSITWERDRYDDQGNYWEHISDPDAGDFRNANLLDSPQEDGYTLSALLARWNGPGFDVISSTSYFDRAADQNTDGSQQASALLIGTPFTNVPTRSHYNIDQEQWSQELRIESANPDGALDWVAGVFYSKTKQRDFQGVEGSGSVTMFRQALGIPDSFSDTEVLGLVFPGYPVLAEGVYAYLDDIRSEDEQLAVFAQIDYRFTPTLKVTAGVRFSDNSYSFEQVRDGFFAGGLVPLSGEGDERPVTPKVSLSWEPDENNLFYVTASKGFRVGGASSRPPVFCDADLAALGYDSAPTSYGPDSLWNYEIGAKNRLLGGRLQTGASAFLIERKDTQGFLRLPTCGFSLTTNLGDARSVGFDLVAQLALENGISIYASAGYVDAEYTQDVGNGVSLINRDGEPMQISPWSASGSVQYDFSVWGGRSAFVRAQYDYKARYNDTRPYRPTSDPTIPPYGEISTLSARASVEFGAWDLALFGDNLTDAAPELSRVRESGTSLYYNNTLQPRTIGLSATFRY